MTFCCKLTKKEIYKHSLFYVFYQVSLIDNSLVKLYTSTDCCSYNEKCIVVEFSNFNDFFEKANKHTSKTLKLNTYYKRLKRLGFNLHKKNNKTAKYCVCYANFMNIENHTKCLHQNEFMTTNTNCFVRTRKRKKMEEKEKFLKKKEKDFYVKFDDKVFKLEKYNQFNFNDEDFYISLIANLKKRPFIKDLYEEQFVYEKPKTLEFKAPGQIDIIGEFVPPWYLATSLEYNNKFFYY